MNHTITSRAVLLVVVTSLAACAPGQLQVKPGSVHTCVDTSRKTPAQLIGWGSVPSANALVDAVQQVGQRMGKFAPQVSLRKVAVQQLDRMMKKHGVTGAEWFRLDRPVHMIVRLMGKAVKKPTVILHTNGEAAAAFAGVINPKIPAEGHSYVIEPNGRRGRKMPPLLVTETEYGVAAFSPPGTPAKGLPSLANCVAQRQSTHLLEIGLSAAAVADMLGGGAGPIGRLLRKFGPMGAPIKATVEKLVKSLRQSTWGTFALDLDDKHVALRGSLVAQSGTELASQWKAESERAPNPYLAEMPANSWFLGSQGPQDPDDLKMTLNMQMDGPLKKYKALLKPVLKSFMARATGPGAGAFFAEPAFPASLYSVVEMKDSRQLLNDLDGLIKRFAQKAVDETVAKVGKANPVLQQIAGGGFIALVAVLNKALDKRGAQVQLKSRSVNGQRCDFISVLGLQSLPIRSRQLKQMLPDVMELGVCTSATHLRIGMSPNASNWLGTKATGPLAKKLSTQPWFNGVTEMSGYQTTSFAALYPTPVLDWMSKFIPILPRWKSGSALTFRCGHQPTTAACEVEISMGLLDMVQAFQASRAGRR